ncbi:MAG TPA: S8 family serine peptidase [Granulicella sp.]
MFAHRSLLPPIPFLLPFLFTAAVLQATEMRATAQDATRQTPLGEIVPNHYLVVYQDAAIPSDAEARTRLAGARVLRQHTRLGVTVVAANGTADDAANMQHLAAQRGVRLVVHDRMVYAHQAIYHNPLAKPLTPMVALVNQPAPAMAAADSYYNSPQGWAVRQVGGYGNSIPGGPARGPWNVTMGKGVKIAILDTGLDAAHPDIAPNLIYNRSEVDQTPGTGLPSPCDDGSPQDQTGHGTWTASLAAGAEGDGTGLVIGVAPQASLLNIKVLERMPDFTQSTAAAQCENGQASGLMSWVLQGIEDAVEQHADVISMSLGSMVDLTTGDGAGLKTLFDQAAYAAEQTGTVLVAAAGNDGFDLSNPRYIELPAQARGVVAIVASTNPACAENLASGAVCAPGPVTLPYYSNYGAPLNALAAPGGDLPAGADDAVSGWVRGACSQGKPATTDGLPGDGSHSFGCFNMGHAAYVQAMGTSASAPLAAGVTALFKAAHPGWDATAIVAAMRSGATPATASLAYSQATAAGLSASRLSIR